MPTTTPTTTYTIVTSGGRRTQVDGYLSEVVESLKGRRTYAAVYVGTLLLCQVLGKTGEVVWAVWAV